MSGAQTTFAGIGKGLMGMGRGAQQALLMPYEGKAVEAYRSKLGQEETESRKLDAPLLATKGGKVGNVVGTAIPAVAASLIPGANTLAGSTAVGALTGAAQPTVEGESRALNAGLGAAGGVAGYGVGKGLEKGLRAASGAMGSPQRQAAAQGMNQMRDQVAAEARAAGFKIPPSQTNPTLTNRLLEGTAGKITTSQHASKANEAVTQRLIAKDLGIKEVTPASVAAVRERAGAVYETLKNQAPFQADDALRAELAQIGQANKDLAVEFPSLARGNADKMIEQIASRPQFSASSTVEAIKQLRNDAKLLWRGSESTGDPAKAAMAEANRKVADALEGMIERNLAGSAPNLLPQFRQAREMIAKAHSVESAMNDATGFVPAQALGKQLQAGAPLTGELATIGKTAMAFPRATQSLGGQSVLPVSPLDMTNLGLMGGVSAATSNPLWMIPAVARPGIRAALLSKPYQTAFGSPSYTPALTSTAKLARALAPGLGAAALPQAVQK
jgi:hypothetical protein